MSILSLISTMPARLQGVFQRFPGDTAIASVVKIRVRESFPAASECANLCTVTQPLPNGKTADASFIVVYKVNGEGKVESLRAFWDFDSTMQRMQAQMAQ